VSATRNVLESALARPQQKWHDAADTDLATVAAAFGFGLVKNHPYRDGNTRIGLLAIAAFLGIIGTSSVPLMPTW
jgi:death-on-curing protein